MMAHKHQRAVRWGVGMAFIASMTFLISCGQGSGGPCEHTFRSAIVEITSAVVAGTNAPVSNLTIHRVTRNGQNIELGALVHTPAHGITLQGNVLACTVPCGLGTQEGTYKLLIEGGGFPPREVEVNAQYRTFQGGCPSYNDDGTEVELELGP